MENMYLNILVSSSVLVSFVTGLFALFISVKNNNFIKRNQIITYRYKILHKLLSEIIDIKNIDFDISEDRLMTTVKLATERYHNIEKIYKKTKPLLDESIALNIDSIHIKCTQISNEMVRLIYTKKNANYYKILCVKEYDLKKN